MADNLGVNPIPFSSSLEGISFPDIAKDLVYQVVKRDLEDLDRHGTFGHDEVYIVWFAFVLGSWKALVSTSLPDGRYYEVTYNSLKKEAYIDSYVKTEQFQVAIDV